MKKRFGALMLCFTLLSSCTLFTLTPQSAAPHYTRVNGSVAGDLSKTEVYEFDNGLRVYLSVNDDEPTISARIVARAGAIDDPMDKTGLAHYLEHLLFKGSERIGTTDYAAEKKILDQIEALYTQHEQTTDPARRADLYRQIDALSVQANDYTIANEYDKLLSSIGASDINAYTSTDHTAFQSAFPANQISNYIELEYERFRAPVFRGFQTELETVYEEWNMYLDNPQRRAYADMQKRFYGDQRLGTPIIGTPHDLQNPSPARVMDFYKTYYVPNNMALCFSGDLDTARTLDLIGRTFGSMPRGKEVAERVPVTVKPFAKGETLECTTTEMPSINIVWTAPLPDSSLRETMLMTSLIMSNANAGIIDRNLVFPRKVTRASFGVYDDQDHIFAFLGGTPLPSASLESLKALLLEQIQQLKDGQFEEQTLHDILTNLKLSNTLQNRSNNTRVRNMIGAFKDELSWEYEAGEMARLEKVTKEDIIRFANTYLNDKFLTVYMREGEYAPVDKMTKLSITPLTAQRSVNSDYYNEFVSRDIPEIAPQFPDLDKEIEQIELRDQGFTTFEYVCNDKDNYFSAVYEFYYGSLYNRYAPILCTYLGSCGTEKYTSEELNARFFALGGSYSVKCTRDRVTLTIDGLAENMEQLCALGNELMRNPRFEENRIRSLSEQILRRRLVDKQNPEKVLLDALRYFALYGEHNPATFSLSEKELVALSTKDLQNVHSKLIACTGNMRLYAPKAEKTRFLESEKCLKLLENRKDIPNPLFAFTNRAPTTQRHVYFVDMPTSSAQLFFYRTDGAYDTKLGGVRAVFNEAFGVGMSSVVFQDLRETQSLCYSCSAAYVFPERKDEKAFYMLFMSCQPHKLEQAINAAVNLKFNVSDDALNKYRDALVKVRQAKRYEGEILFEVEDYAGRLQLPKDYLRAAYERLQKVTPEDVRAFYAEHVQGKPVDLFIVADSKNIDMKALEKYGPIIHINIDSLYPASDRQPQPGLGSNK